MTVNTASAARGTLAPPDQKLLNSSYVEDLPVRKITFIFEDDNTYSAFKALARTLRAPLEGLRPEKFTSAQMWKWVRSNNPHLEKQYSKLALYKTPEIAEEFVRREWAKAHPGMSLKPKSGRPRGQLTPRRVDGLANARALQWLLAVYAQYGPSYAPPFNGTCEADSAYSD